MSFSGLSMYRFGTTEIIANDFHKKSLVCRRLPINLEAFIKNEANFIKELEEHPDINCVAISGDMSFYITNLIDVLRNTKVKIIEIMSSTMHGENLIFLAIGLKYSKFTSLQLRSCGIEGMETKFLAAALNGSCISQLCMPSNNIGDEGICFLANGVRNTDVKYLNVHANGITNNGITFLARALQTSSLTYIDLSRNQIKDAGVQYLAGFLKNSNVSKLNLDGTGISDVGIRCLADRLKDSCVTSLSLDGNEITDRGIEYLVNRLQDTQVVEVQFGVSLANENTEMVMVNAISRNCANAKKIRDTFEKLVIQNTQTNDLEFLMPEDINDFDIAVYLRFIKQFNDKVYVKGHLFDLIREHNCSDYPHVVSKINEFIAKRADRFCTFIENEFLGMMEIWKSYDYLDLVKQFESLNLSGAVQYMLLHRALYFVDEDEEILHPFIYKLLHKYSMPLYGVQLEPDKKHKIISFYQTHQEIEGAQEIIDLLGSMDD